MIATLGTVGGVAQLGERTVRIRKVESSILFVSTKTKRVTLVVTLFVFMQKRMDRTLEKAVAFSQVLRRKTWTIAILAQNRSSDPLRHCFILTNLLHIDIISGVVNLFAGLAQLVEQLICNQQVGGSSPVIGTKNPVHESGRDFYLLPIYSSLSTK